MNVLKIVVQVILVCLLIFWINVMVHTFRKPGKIPNLTIIIDVIGLMVLVIANMFVHSWRQSDKK
jgi:hypothetical protein